jgi:hypothetical protein
MYGMQYNVAVIPAQGRFNVLSPWAEPLFPFRSLHSLLLAALLVDTCLKVSPLSTKESFMLT